MKIRHDYSLTDHNKAMQSAGLTNNLTYKISVHGNVSGLLAFTGGEIDFLDIKVTGETVEERKANAENILQAIEKNNDQVSVTIQYKSVIDWPAVNAYLSQDFDINDLPMNVLKSLYIKAAQSQEGFTNDSIEKLETVSNAYLQQFENKNIALDNVKGKIKKVGNGYGFFKERAKKCTEILNIGIVENLRVR